MANFVDFPVAPCWGNHYRKQGLVVQEENLIDFSCSDAFQDHYHNRLLTPFHTPEPDQQECLVETVARLADEIHQLRYQLSQRQRQQVPPPHRPQPTPAPKPKPPMPRFIDLEADDE